MFKISVIIPTLNRDRLLERTLDSIVKQTYPADCFETIVVDNGSTDNTAVIAEKYKNVLKNFIYIYEPTPGLHVGRHTGLKHANAEILVFTDDDIRACPTWLEGVSESFEDPEVALAGGNIFPDFESERPPWFDSLWFYTPWGKAISQYSILDFGSGIKEISPYYIWGCNFSIRKSILKEIGGFNPDGMPSELLRYRGDGETAVSDKILRRGYKTIFNPAASVFHLVSTSRMTLEYLYKRSYSQGISDSFTRIRKAGGFNREITIRSWLRWCVTYFRNIFKNQSQAKKIVWQGYWNGYFYHYKQVMKDPDLLKWVLKENFLNE